jgi:putative copper resistance protein D
MSDWPLIAVRFGVYLALGGLFGLSAFGYSGLRMGERDNALALRGWLIACGIAGLLLSACWLVLLASSMAGEPPWPVDRASIDALLSAGAIGTAWKIRMIALLLATLAAIQNKSLPFVVLASSVALAMLAWTGHGSVDEGPIGWLHLGADILHLVASAAWVGALLGLVMLVMRPLARVDSEHLDLTHRALHGFGTIGTIVVATLVVTGLVNSWLMVGVANVPGLPTTLYGQLLIAKLVLFTAMIALAALNRFRLTPYFEKSIANADHRGALTALRRSLALETALVVGILGLVAWLGTLAPPASLVL